MVLRSCLPCTAQNPHFLWLLGKPMIPYRHIVGSCRFLKDVAFVLGSDAFWLTVNSGQPIPRFHTASSYSLAVESAGRRWLISKSWIPGRKLCREPSKIQSVKQMKQTKQTPSHVLKSGIHFSFARCTCNVTILATLISWGHPQSKDTDRVGAKWCKLKFWNWQGCRSCWVGPSGLPLATATSRHVHICYIASRW